MCTGAEIAGLVLGGISTVSLLSQGKPKAPEPVAMAEPPAPEPPPQAAKVPDQAAIKRKNASTALTGPLVGAAGTALTGPSGIEDNMLNLGRNTKLGQ